LVLFLTGCLNGQSSEESRFVGTWDLEGYDNSFTFFSDGTMSGLSFVSANYEVKNNKLVISVPMNGASMQSVYYYKFDSNDNHLILTEVSSGSVMIFIKR